MKKNKFEKLFFIALAMVTLVGTIGVAPQGIKKVLAATTTVKDVNFGTGGIDNPTNILWINRGIMSYKYDTIKVSLLVVMRRLVMI